MSTKVRFRRRQAADGFSIIELLIICAVIVILGAIAIPQIASSRRNLRMTAVPRQLMTQLRLARQLAMTRNRAVTFSLTNATKGIRLVVHNNPGTDGVLDTADDVNFGAAVLSEPGYPLTPGSSVIRTDTLAQGGLLAAEIVMGVAPPGAPTTLGDTSTMTAFTNGTINITFQPDGSVVNAAGATQDFAIFMHRGGDAPNTASAVSVLGASGRAKLWRYNGGTNTYLE